MSSRGPATDGEPHPVARDFTPLAELDGLRDLVRALRAGEVDGLVVDSGDGDEVLTLSGADRPYRLFIEAMAQGAATISQDGIVLSANPRLAEILATSREELVGGRVTSLLDPGPGDHAMLGRVLSPVPTAEVRLSLRTRDDRLVPVAITSSLLHLDGESVVCLIVSDETERERAARLLRFHGSLLDAVGEAIIATDVAGRITYANAAAGQLYGWDPGELLGRPVTEVTVPERVGAQAAEIMEHVLAGQTWSGEFDVVRRDGHRFPVQVTDTPLLDASGTLLGVIGISRDISDRREAQEQLAASERWFRTLVASSSDLIVVVDAEARLTYANPACEHVLGFAPEDMLGHSMFDLIHPDDLAEVAARFGTATTRPGVDLPTEFRFATADRGWRVLEAVSTNCLDDDAIAGMVINARDVTDANAVRDALADREHLLREAQRITHVGHWRYDPADDRLTWLSDELFAIHGLSPDSWGGTKAHYLEVVHPDDRESVERAVTSAIANGRSIVEHRVVRPDGEVRHVRNKSELIHGADGQDRIVGTCQDITEQVEIKAALLERLKELTALTAVSRTAHLVNDPERLCALTVEALRSAMTTTQQLAVHVTIDDAGYGTAPMDGTRMVAEADVLVDGDRRGAVRAGYLDGSIEILPEERALVGTVAETLSLWLARNAAAAALEAANAELQTLNAQLEEAGRFKDDLLSMASHELRTPLTPILGFLDVLTNHDAPLSEQQTQIVEVIRRNAQRMLSLVEDMLVAGRAMAGPLHALSSDVTLSDVVDRIVDELGPTIPTVDRTVEGWHIRSDVTHLHQVLGNLLTNATKHGAAPISITASSHEPGWVTVDVTDRGSGVPEEFVPQMWDRFTQSDRGNTRSSRGVGLGLAIVRLLIEADGGRISYRPGSPEGAVFSFELPGYYDTEGPRRGGRLPDSHLSRPGA